MPGRHPRLVETRRDAASQARDEDGSASSSFELTALVCGERPLLVRSLTHLLEAEAPAIRFAAAGSHEEGARVAREVAADVIVVTVDAPGPAAVDAIRFFRQSCGSARLLLLAPDGDDGQVRQAIQAGAAGYLAREGDARTVVRAIQLVRAGLAVMPAALVEGVATAEAPRPDVALSPTQRDMLIGIAYGDGNRLLASRLHMSERTVARRLHELYELLGVRGRREAAEHARTHGALLRAEEEAIATAEGARRSVPFPSRRFIPTDRP